MALSRSPFACPPNSDRRVEGVWQFPRYVVFQYIYQCLRVRIEVTRSSEQARAFTFSVTPIFPVVFHFVFLSSAFHEGDTLWSHEPFPLAHRYTLPIKSRRPANHGRIKHNSLRLVVQSMPKCCQGETLSMLGKDHCCYHIN
jgi:hypothetical protein